jgi:AcrR family transcriptional regulator
MTDQSVDSNSRRKAVAPKIVDKDEKRRAIALASVEVFGSKGFERTRMEDVAKKAGVGKGTLYEYFKNKEELMDGAFKVLFVDMMASLMPEQSPEQSPTETLIAITRGSMTAMQEVGFAYRFFLEYMLHKSRTGDSTHLAEFLSYYRGWLAELIEKGIACGEFRDDIAPFETAAAIAAWIDGAGFHYYTMPDSLSIEQMGERFLEAVLDGIRTKPDKK